MAHDTYTSPFQTRYASKEMQYIFSEDNKFKTWRRLWIALAKAEQKQGLPITEVYKTSGFGGYNHFFRAFKKEYGMTPKEYFHTTRQDARG